MLYVDDVGVFGEFFDDVVLCVFVECGEAKKASDGDESESGGVYDDVWLVDVFFFEVVEVVLEGLWACAHALCDVCLFFSCVLGEFEEESCFALRESHYTCIACWFYICLELV